MENPQSFSKRAKSTCTLLSLLGDPTKEERVLRLIVVKTGYFYFSVSTAPPIPITLSLKVCALRLAWLLAAGHGESDDGNSQHEGWFTVKELRLYWADNSDVRGKVTSFVPKSPFGVGYGSQDLAGGIKHHARMVNSDAVSSFYDIADVLVSSGWFDDEEEVF